MTEFVGGPDSVAEVSLRSDVPPDLLIRRRLPDAV
jgi:hypothetical protein